MKKVGFIGLGTMGRGMALNIRQAGFDLCVYDVNPEAVAILVAKGAQAAESPKEVAQWADVVLTMLPDIPHVEAVYLGENGLLEGAHEGLTLIDSSTVSPDCSRKISLAAREKGVVMFDAPVGGNPLDAATGSLTMLAGGDRKDILACREVLDACSARTLFCGPVGAGSALKLANNLMTLIHHQMIAEGYNLAKMAGVNTTTLVELQRHNVPNIQELLTLLISAEEYQTGFAIPLANKDLKLALNMANELGAPVSLGAIVKSSLQTLINQGKSNLSAQAVHLLYKHQQ
jgi:2-hydroxy-3-oxopropionate reductase